MKYDLTTDQIEQLLDMRGGCTCFLGHPPCGACSEPITPDEAEQLGLTPDPQPAPAVDYMKAVHDLCR